MKLKEALPVFDGHIANGKVPDRRHPGTFHKISAGRRDVIISHVRNAVAHAAGIDRRDVAALDEVELDPFIATLPDHAYRDAKAQGRTSPRNERTNVALFRATIEGREYETTPKHGYAKRRPVLASNFLNEWRPLYQALLADCTNADGRKNSRKSFPAQLLALQNLLGQRGIHSPYDIPDDYHLFMQWADEAGVAYKKKHAMLAALRRAREILEDPGIPTLYMGAHSTERGLGSLPNLPELLAERGCHRDPRHMRQEELVQILAPTMHGALERYLAEGRRRNRRPGWIDDQIGMTSRIAASAIRLGYDVSTMTYVDLWTRTTIVTRTDSGDDVDPVFAAVMGPDYVHEEESTLIRCMADEMSRLSYRNSPIEVVTAEPLPSHHVPIYTARVIQDLKYSYLLVREVFGEMLQKHRRSTWEAVSVEYGSLMKMIHKHNKDLHTKNHKPKGLVPILWPQAVCLFLPWLMSRVEEARATLNQFFRSHGRAGSRTHRTHMLAFDEALKEYVLAALLLDDGLRIKNYAGALANRHVMPTVEKDRRGTWLRITGLSTCFRGVADHPSVTLKVAKDEVGAERIRIRAVSPGIVRFDYVQEYWLGTRPRDLVRRGALARVEDFNPDQDDYAFFISPRTGGRKSAKKIKEAYAAAHGCFGEDYLSNIFGRRFHQYIREVMKLDVPAWEDPVRTREWRGIFTAHIVRLLIATYFGGILGDWGTACYLTDDTEQTLKRNYNRVSDRIAALMHVDGAENPRYFNDVIVRARRLRPGDNWRAFWQGFDPNQLADSLNALTAVREQTPPARRRRKPRKAA